MLKILLTSTENYIEECDIIRDKRCSFFIRTHFTNARAGDVSIILLRYHPLIGYASILKVSNKFDRPVADVDRSIRAAKLEGSNIMDIAQQLFIMKNLNASVRQIFFTCQFDGINFTLADNHVQYIKYENYLDYTFAKVSVTENILSFLGADHYANFS
jgi:hypothetical protein